MDWNEEEARKAVADFHSLFTELDSEFPECVGKISSAWRKHYLTCGHRRLGRIILGHSPERACERRASRE